MTARYLALEGIDGAGKSTVARELVTRMEATGCEVLLVREPGSTWLGEEVRRLLLDAGELVPWAEVALFAAQRAQLVEEVIAPGLARGAWVVSDRSYYSSLAYQGVARGLGLDRVRAINETVVGGVLPGLVVVLDVDPAVGNARQIQPDRIGDGGLAFQQAVAEGYRRLAAAEPERISILDGSERPDEIAEQVMEMANTRWPR